MRKYLKNFSVFLGVLIFMFSMVNGSIVKAATFKDNQTVDVDKKWTIKFNKEVLFDDFTKQNIKVIDSKGNIVNTTLNLGKDNKTIIINAPKGGYLAGEKYQLNIGEKVHSKNKKDLKQPTEFKFNIKNKTDNPVITFKDENLEKVIRQKINKPTGNILKRDVERITEIYFWKRGIKDLSGIENLTNLEDIDLSYNEISDVSPLKSLTNLKNLYLKGNQIKDISVLKELNNIENLYLYSGMDYNGVNEVLENKIKEIINSCIKEDMTDLQKELAVHDYIVLNSKYDYDNYLNDTIPKDAFNAYGVLVKGSGVCKGYAEAMKLLLNRVGIECDIVTGKSYKGVGHAWNIFKIDGEYYQLDSTWDDPVPDKKGYVRYKYFNISDKQMEKDHKDWKSDKTCVSERFSYFTNMEYAVKDEQWMYYSNNSDNKLYKIKLDGTNNTKITEDRAIYLATYGDWIYFSNYSRGGNLYKIRKDGTEKKQLNSVHSKNLYIENNKLYYTNELTGKIESMEYN